MEVRGFVTSYETVDERFTQSMEYNSSIGPKSIYSQSESYSIFCMGDSHIGGTKNTIKFFELAQKNKAIGAVLAGDITTGHESDYLVLEKTLPHPDTLNVFAVAGNHDLYFDGWKSYFRIFGTSTYYFEVITPSQKDLFIGLDTGGGTLGNKQVKWLKNLLKTTRENYRFCTVLTHNNLLRLRGTASTNPNAEEVQVLLDLGIRYAINMVITGHDHIRNSAKFGHTHYIIMDDFQDTNSKASLLKVDFDKNNFSYKYINMRNITTY